MKLTIICMFTLALIQYGDCQSTWFPDIVGVITNKTSELKNYVQEKGRSIKKFYYDKVHSKINCYFGRCDRERNLELERERDQQARERHEVYLKKRSQTQILNDIYAPSPWRINMRYCTDCLEGDPAIYMTTPQLLALNGYPAESHTVVTEDGYILTLHRIPHNKVSNGSKSIEVPRKTVLLHHGLLGSSADWILPGPEKGLAYILSAAGYDVWLANVRGNTYSRAHISYNTDSYDFWNFTFHEVSQYDLPAIIDYIMETKGSDVKINYIGHSMGTTVLFALLSTKTHYNKVLRAGYALAPVAYMTDVRGPLKLLAAWIDNIAVLFRVLGQNEFLPQNAFIRWLSWHACEINHYEQAICENSLFVLCGYDEKQFNRTLLPIILGHVPAGASTKTLVHYAQEINQGGQFQMYDFGREGNLRQYGSPTPPQYPLHKITLPIALFGSQNDRLASNEAVTKLYLQLANPIEHYLVPLKEFNHIDFLWAIDAPKLVYKKLLELLEEPVDKTVDKGVLTNELN